MKREDVDKLLGWAREAQKVFDESGETDFEELRRREQNMIFNSFMKLGFDYDGDGDCDSCYLKTVIDNVTVTFVGHAESIFPEDMMGNLDYMSFSIDHGDTCFTGSRLNLAELVEYLESLLSGQTTIVNLTPHEITVYDAAGESVLQVIPSSGMARAAQTREPLDRINGIPVSKTGYGAVEGLPDQRDGVVYIVSVLTAQAAPNRKDLYIVDELVRDDTGRILGCKALAQI